MVWAAHWGFLTIVVALGAMFGKILHETGALDQIAAHLLKSFGEKRAHYALGIAGLVCALPLFFDVAIVLLIGVVFAVARRTNGNVVKMAIRCSPVLRARQHSCCQGRYRCC
ncbi:Gnt-I system [Hafnia alvei]|uniref:Gnt-I system n=1 Tax=Hafnia alvei TaxID=569 RepID=A0A377PKA3_HAFAL|nr:Gnt-I system [Hafnia alvei]